MKKILPVILCTWITVSASAQLFNIGVRAGLNYSQWKGPMESSINEDYGISSGFHFGLNYQQNFSDLFSMRLEILYVQNGSTKSFNGESFYVISVPNAEDVVEFGQMDYNLDISNAYISFPLTAHYQLSRKWEVMGGAYLSLLVQPTATGLLEFDSSTRPDEISFIQSMEFNYNSDEPGQGQFVGINPGILVDGIVVRLPSLAGAYYQYNEKRDNLINALDYGLVFGLSYNINRGFYIGLRAEYGLADITSDQVDISQVAVDENQNFIYRDDKDTHLGIQASFGFRF